jgi:hypothetical protein
MNENRDSNRGEAGEKSGCEEIHGLLGEFIVLY